MSKVGRFPLALREAGGLGRCLLWKGLGRALCNSSLESRPSLPLQCPTQRDQETRSCFVKCRAYDENLITELPADVPTIGPLAALDENQEPEGARGEARGRGGLFVKAA
jgi:hypothetical protein